MDPNRDEPTALCNQCFSGHLVPVAEPGNRRQAHCPQCGAVVYVGDTVIDVHGQDAKEVQSVAGALLAQEAERRGLAEQAEAERRAAAKLASPWMSGSFYLIASVAIVGVVLVVATVLPLWALPLVTISALVLLAVVGALQLRQDAKLSEKHFLALMRLAMSQLKLLGRQQLLP